MVQPFNPSPSRPCTSTGAELLSMVQPADENKTFSVVFRTPPENSNGIAHVLEHSVLCGSRKYPLKEWVL